MDKFIKVNEKIFKSKILKANEKLVYISLTSYLKYGTNTGNVYPSEATISNDTDLCVNTVKKCLKSLENKGFIKIEHRKFMSNIYTIVEPMEVLSKYANVEPRAKKQRESVKDKIKKSYEHKQEQKHQKEVETLEQIKERYYYDDIASVTSSEDAEIIIKVIGKALKGIDKIRCKNISELTKDELVYMARKYKEQKEKQSIPNPYGYLTTMLNNAKKQYKEYLQILENQQNQTTTTTPTYNTTGRYQTIDAATTITDLPTCNKTIDTKNSFNNFAQRSYDYDSFYDTYLKPQYSF